MQQTKLACGNVRYFNLWKGYGFIEPEDPSDPAVWAHVSVLEGFPEHLPYMAEGEEVH
jgi:cold shock CspA family protein